MKKTIQLLLVIGMLFACPVVNAQSRAMKKAMKKEYKLKKKELSKGGWVIYGTSRSLDVALLRHYERLNETENAHEIMGIATAFKSKNIGKQVALNNACNLYARQAGSHVKGRVVSDMANNADDVSAEFDHFYAAYETLVEKEIRGEMIESLCVIRETGKEKKTGAVIYEMQTYYVIDEAAASAARIRAFEQAMMESAAAQKHAEMVSKFINEGFEVGE